VHEIKIEIEIEIDRNKEERRNIHVYVLKKKTHVDNKTVASFSSPQFV
jgi:hypothetical protein